MICFEFKICSVIILDINKGYFEQNFELITYLFFKKKKIAHFLFVCWLSVTAHSGIMRKEHFTLWCF